MARIQPTRIEQLDAKFPGLRQSVDLLLDGHATLEEIQRRIVAATKEVVPIRTISNYKQQRWLVARRRIEAIKEHAQAIIEVLGKNGVGEVRQAQLFERVQAIFEAGGPGIDPEVLLVEERKREELALKRQQLEQEKQALELKIAQAERQRERETAEVKKAVEEVKDPNELRRKINEIYGISAA